MFDRLAHVQVESREEGSCAFIVAGERAEGDRGDVRSLLLSQGPNATYGKPVSDLATSGTFPITDRNQSALRSASAESAMNRWQRASPAMTLVLSWAREGRFAIGYIASVTDALRSRGTLLRACAADC